MAACVLIYLIVTCSLYYYNKSALMRALVEFVAQYGAMQNRLLKELELPYAILLENGKILWMNDEFESILGDRNKQDVNLVKYMKELNRGTFPKEEGQQTQVEVEFEDREYLAKLRRIPAKEAGGIKTTVRIPVESEYFIAVFLEDVTELNEYIQANEEQRLVAGLIYIDNYDEVIESVEEVRQSLLLALIDRKINQYFAKANGIVKKVETDKYFIVVAKQYFKLLEEDRFSLLEDVKSVNVGNTIPATLGIGLGISREGYCQSYNYARVAIDQALARGGDQAVIKDCGITYYGGKREMTSKNTRVNTA